MSADGPPTYKDDMPPPAHEAAADLLDLAEEGDGGFSAAVGGRNHIGTVFGGRLIAQALLAATRTVAAMPATALHAAFLAPGRVDCRTVYRVAALRDSRRFATRQVTAWQGDLSIFTLLAAFHAPEDGFAHQHAAMPDVPPPERVMPLQHYVAAHADRIDPSAIANFSGATPIELRPIDPDAFFMRRSDRPRRFWFRLAGMAGIEDTRLQQCLLAFASDYWLGGVAAIPHVFPTNGRELLISSMDHALWFHRPARCDDWLLHDTVSATAGDGLGLAQGRIFDRAGRLVATTTQECLLRRLDRDQAGGTAG